MFRGNHPTRVDEKGRLKVPAEFKRVIDEKYAQRFYITSLDGTVAQIYPFEEGERIEAKLASLSTFNPTKKKFLNLQKDKEKYFGKKWKLLSCKKILSNNSCYARIQNLNDFNQILHKTKCHRFTDSKLKNRFTLIEQVIVKILFTITCSVKIFKKFFNLWICGIF